MSTMFDLENLHSLTREKAEEHLKNVFGIDHFYDEQWRAIEKILRGERVLMIERTGFGKSLCYQFPATLFPGITVIFSPLIALMRDQVRGLNERGIPAAYINSEQLPEENTQIIASALRGGIKILYIAPERQENREWIEATREMNLSMIVIDEAHTISTWGHDFRPAFRRIIDLVQLLPLSLPVLATTATATKKVQQDIETQIGGKLTTIRGSLVRENFLLHVIIVHSEEEKMLWLAQNLNKIPGTGLIYTGTRINTEIYAHWLSISGINAVCYNAGFDVETRKAIENGLMNNQYKCVVSTNALGMGIDKPDIRFIIHTQIPESPVHYYQEIGRAGRDGLPTHIVLFYNERRDADNLVEDVKLPASFIESARPKIEKYQKVIEILKEEPLGEREIMKRANLKQNQVRTIKADLIEQGIIRESMYGSSKKYEYQFDAKPLDTEHFDRLRERKIKELEAMVGYVRTTKPRMQYLCEFLDSAEDVEFKNCDNTNLQKTTVVPDPAMVAKLEEFHENDFPTLEVKEAKSGTLLENGYAASYYGVSNVGSALHRSKYEDGGDFPDFLLKKALSLFGKKYRNVNFDLILYVPPTCSGDLVRNFATKFSNVTNIPISHDLRKVKQTSEQKIFQNNYNKRDNVRDAFDIEASVVTGKTILLIDDIYDSGATLKEIGRILTIRGAKMIMPLVIAKTVGGTL